MPRKYADQIDTDPVLARQLIRQQYPHWAHEPIVEVAPAGTVNALYRLGGDKVIRLPLRREWSADNEKDRQDWVDRIAPLLPVATPTLLATGVPAAGYPCTWSIYRWLPGTTPDPTPSDGAHQLAADLVAFLGALHGIDATGWPCDNVWAGPLTDRADLRGSIAALDGLADSADATAVWEAALALPARPHPPVVIHGDLYPGNLLMVDGRLNAVIDWTPLLGDPAHDLICAWNLLPAATRDDLRLRLDIDEATWMRGRALALARALLVLPDVRDTNPAITAYAKNTIHEVLTDYRER